MLVDRKTTYGYLLDTQLAINLPHLDEVPHIRTVSQLPFQGVFQSRLFLKDSVMSKDPVWLDRKEMTSEIQHTLCTDWSRHERVCVCVDTPEVLGSSFGRSVLTITTDVLSCWWIVSQNKTPPYINQIFRTIGLFSPTFPITFIQLLGGMNDPSSRNSISIQSDCLKVTDRNRPEIVFSTYHSFSSFAPFSKWSK